MYTLGYCRNCLALSLNSWYFGVVFYFFEFFGVCGKTGEVVFWGSISRVKVMFEKGYLPNWSEETYKIVKVKPTTPVTYVSLFVLFYSRSHSQYIYDTILYI